MLTFIRRTEKENSIDKTADALSLETGFEHSLCRLLVLRGITDKNAAEKFLAPSFSDILSPFGFNEMQKCVTRIRQARENNEKICIYGDYDVDGICATSILYTYLKHEGYNIIYYIPSRKTEGYGMNDIAVTRLHDEGVSLIITVDNGIAASDEIKLAYDLGMQVIVTDHHKPQAVIPECEAVLCHTLEDEAYENKSICGAGTALKIVHALGGDDAAKAFLPFAGLASVADVVELNGENRAIVSLALSIINSEDCPACLRAITDVARPNRKSPITERDFAFGIAPRLNAAGRMDSATLGVELLCSESYDEAYIIAQKLDELNTERRDAEAQILREAEEMLSETDITDTRIIILKSKNWNAGIVGIAAAKITEKYYRPTILLAETDGILKGSARSTPEINIFDAMQSYAQLCIKFGGHAFAAGVTLSEENFAEYREALNSYIKDKYANDVFIPKKVYDDEIDLSEVTVELAEMTEKLAPFGEGNPKPVLLIRNAKIENPKRIGAELTHLNGKVVKGGIHCDMVAFDKGYLFDTLINAGGCDIAFSPSVNEWGNTKRVQLRAIDFEPAEIADTAGYFAKHKNDLMQSFAKNLNITAEKTENKFISCDDEFINTTLQESFDGTLILCMDAKASRDIMELIKGKGCHADRAFFAPQSDMCAFNTVVFAPDLCAISMLNTKKYKKLIVCGCISDEQLSYLATCFCNATLYAHHVTQSSDEAKAFYMASERGIMGGLYTCIMKQMRSGNCYRDELLQSVSAIMDTDAAICEFALDTFIDLGLYFQDKNGKITPNSTVTRVELDNAERYKKVRCDYGF